MLKELLPFVFATQEPPAQRTEPMERNEGGTIPQENHPPAATPAASGYASFDDIYRGAPAKASRVTYSILKVAEMAESPRLEGMSQENKRACLLMALEAAGVSLDDLLQDAMIRQRALNDYDEAQQKKLKEFEALKLEENRRIQAELDRISAQHIGRIQANLDEVARQQDLFHSWQKEKQQESRRMTEAAAICVPQNQSHSGDSLTLVIERVTGPHR